MNFLSEARQILIDLPVSDVLRERLALALDRLEESERQNAILRSQAVALEAKVAELESEKTALQTRLQNAELDIQNQRQEMQAQKKLVSLVRHGSAPGASNVRVTGGGQQSSRIV